MTRPSKISYEQVAAEADKIVNAGGKPSVRQIRAQLGAGSNQKIQDFLDEWQESRRAHVPPLTLSPDLQRAIVESIQMEISLRTAPLEERIAQQQREIGDYAETIDRIEGDVAERDDLVRQAGAEKAEAEGRAAQLASDLAAARADLDAERDSAERLRVELAKHSLKLESMPALEKEIADLRLRLMETDSQRQEANRGLAAAEARIAAFEEQLVASKGHADALADTLRRQLEEEQARTAAAQRRTDEANEKLEQVRREFEAVRTGFEEEIQRLNEVATTSAAAAGRLEGELTQLRARAGGAGS